MRFTTYEDMEKAMGQLTGRVLEGRETISSFLHRCLKEYCKFGGNQDAPGKGDERVGACQNCCWCHTNCER